jgi:hypothetical protein
MLGNTLSRNILCSTSLTFFRNPSCDLPIRSSLDYARGFTAAVIAIFLLLVSMSTAFGQTPVLTQHYDNARTGQNTNELMLAPANVNPAQFGKLFTQSLDGMEAAQPLYVPGGFLFRRRTRLTTWCMSPPCTTAFTPSMPIVIRAVMQRRFGM